MTDRLHGEEAYCPAAFFERILTERLVDDLGSLQREPPIRPGTTDLCEPGN